MDRCLVLVVLFGLLATVGFGCTSTAPLRVASDIDNAPFAYLDASREPQGREVVMMERVAELLGRPIEWRRMGFSELLDAVARGDVDIVCATLGVTDERAQRVAFTRPYFDTVLAVVVRNGPGEPTSLADLAGRPVHGARGTTSERAIRAILREAVGVFEPEDDLDAYELLRQKRVDAVVMDGPGADVLVAGSWGRLRILDEDLGEEHYALAVAREATELRRHLDAALDELEQSGHLEEWDRQFGLR